MQDNVKQEYVAPEVAILGTFEQITAGASDGTKLDAAFPAGTPKPDLTFS